MPHAKLEEWCAMCTHTLEQAATHKVAEELPAQTQAEVRHEFSNYLCCAHFGQVMGPAAVFWCANA